MSKNDPVFTRQLFPWTMYSKKLSRKINGNNCGKKLAVLRLLGEDFMQGSNNDMYRYIRYKINGHYE